MGIGIVNGAVRDKFQSEFGEIERLGERQHCLWLQCSLLSDSVGDTVDAKAG